MITISEIQQETAQKALYHIKNGANKAISRALNRAADSGKAEAVKRITANYTVKSGSVRNKIEIKKSSEATLRAAVLSKGRPIPLSNFKTNPSNPPKKRPKVLRAGVLKGGLKPIKGAFLARSKSGKALVFQRIGKARYPLKALYGPSLPSMLGTEKVSQFVEDRAKEVFDNRLGHEINRLLGGAK